MGMTINKAIYILENGLNIDGSWSKALNIALDTMRKYQKIEQIVTNILNNTAKEDERYVYDYLGGIIEVVEDGNDTTNTESN